MVFYHKFVGIISFLFSFVICILGLVLIALGYLLRYAKENFFEDLFNDARKKTKPVLENIPKFFPPTYRNIELPEADVNVLADQLSIALLIFGSFFMVLSIFGCCITKHTKRLRVGIYAILLIALTLAMIGTYTNGIDLVIKDMKHSLESYSGLADLSLKGLTWNAIMIGLKCCGVESYKDFQGTEGSTLKNWPPNDLKNFTFNATELLEFLGESLPDIADIPVSDIPGNAVSDIPSDISEITMPDQVNGTGVPNTTPDVRSIIAEKIDEKLKELKLDCHVVDKIRLDIYCKWLDSSNFKTPLACCKSIPDLVNRCHMNENATEKNNNMAHGCVTRVSDYLSRNQMVIITFGGATAFMVLYSLLMVTRVLVGSTDDDEGRSSGTKKTGSGSRRSHHT